MQHPKHGHRQERRLSRRQIEWWFVTASDVTSYIMESQTTTNLRELATELADELNQAVTEELNEWP